jgi:dTDP-4-dehydrorhamnose 3,5-epimerase
MGALSIPDGAKPSGIDGVWTHDLSVIETSGGPVLHMLRADSPLFGNFGEIYFSVVLPGAVKAWKQHSLQSQNFAVPSGLVQVVVYDGRDDSPSKGKLESILLGRPDYYRLLHIPPGLWYGFAGRSLAPSVLANCVDMPHSPEDSQTRPWDDADIPYSWKSR